MYPRLTISLALLGAIAVAAPSKPSPSGLSKAEIKEVRMSCRKDVKKHCPNARGLEQIKCKKEKVALFSEGCKNRIECSNAFRKKCRQHVMKDRTENWTTCLNTKPNPIVPTFTRVKRISQKKEITVPELRENYNFVLAKLKDSTPSIYLTSIHSDVGNLAITPFQPSAKQNAPKPGKLATWPEANQRCGELTRGGLRWALPDIGTHLALLEYAALNLMVYDDDPIFPEFTQSFQVGEKETRV